MTQETFLRQFASDTYRDRNQFLHYLYTVARHLCADESRRPVHQPILEDLPGQDTIVLLSTHIVSGMKKIAGHFYVLRKRRAQFRRLRACSSRSLHTIAQSGIFSITWASSSITAGTSMP